ncbi:MAG: hypothetical protein ACE5I5_14760 [Candidatus Heimdallarchaeota archaeon]
MSIIMTTQEENLDLREANVVDVEFEKQNGNTYEFHVTLYHDDDGEEGYADWWQVETLDGEMLGRRDLTHSHGTQPFTRSKSIITPDGVMYVVIRGHDQTHGYGGQALVVNLEMGEVEKEQQGSESLDFNDYLTSKSITSLQTVEAFSNPRWLAVILLVTLFLSIFLVLRVKRKSYG